MIGAISTQTSSAYPSNTRTAEAPTDDLSVVSWREAMAGKTGDIIVPADEEDREAMNAWFADYWERNPGPSPADGASLPDPNQVLTQDDWKTLASKYDPTHMSQMEYDRFLDDLCELGLISTDDLGQLGHSGYQFKLTKLTAADLEPKLLNSADLPVWGLVPTFRDGAKTVNVLWWARTEKSWKVFDSEQNQWCPSYKAQLFDRVYQVLNGIAHTSSR